MSHTDENIPVLRTPISKHIVPIGSAAPARRPPLGIMTSNANLPLLPLHPPHSSGKPPLPPASAAAAASVTSSAFAYRTPAATPYANRTLPHLPPPFSRTHSEPLLHHPHAPGPTPTMGRLTRAPPSQNVPSSSPTDASTMSFPSSSSHSRTSVSTSATLFEPQLTPTKIPGQEITNTHGLMSPALFPGPYPSAFLYSEPCPLTDKEKKKERENKHVRATESSLNPWDYLAEDGESPEGSSAPLLNEAAIGGQRKPRRRFNNEELQCLEIFWAISHDHKKYARQRLGAWLGVATRHITFWLQNRRQEWKKNQSNGSAANNASARGGGRGTFDPTTGKMRPVPSSCVTAVFPPPPNRTAYLNSVIVGDFTRDMYFAAMETTPTLAGSPVSKLQPPIKPLPRRALSANLDDIQSHRENSFGASIGGRKRQTGGLVLADDTPTRNQQLLDLLTSDPASDPVCPDSEEESDDRAELGRGRPSSSRIPGMVSRPIFGRATSHDLMASSQRARELIAQQARHASDPTYNRPSSMLRPAVKRQLPPVPTHEDAVNKYAKVSATRSVVRSLSASDVGADLPPVGDLLASVAGPSDSLARYDSLRLPMPAGLKEERERKGEDEEADWAASLLLSISKGT